MGAQVWWWFADPDVPGTWDWVMHVAVVGVMLAMTWWVFSLHWPVVLNYIRNGFYDD